MSHIGEVIVFLSVVRGKGIPVGYIQMSHAFYCGFITSQWNPPFSGVAYCTICHDDWLKIFRIDELLVNIYTNS